MKEAFVNVDTLIDQTKILGDMELQAYLSSLSESQKNDFIASNVGQTISAVDASKSSKFSELIDQVTGADNNIVSSAYYVRRTSDLNTVLKDVDNMTVKQLTNTDINSEVAKRQYEINEWSNFNKLDTLYMMQVLFISLSIVGILAFLSSNGTISHSLFSFVSFTVAIVAVLMLIFRWRYTNVGRDGRYWHKAHFRRQHTPTGTGSICPTA